MSVRFVQLVLNESKSMGVGRLIAVALADVADNEGAGSIATSELRERAKLTGISGPPLNDVEAESAMREALDDLVRIGELAYVLGEVRIGDLAYVLGDGGGRVAFQLKLGDAA